MTGREILTSTLYFCRVDQFLRRAKFNQLTILSLHRISHSVDPFYPPITPELFENLVDHLRTYYRIVAFDDIATLVPPFDKPPVILSFDDGYRDFIENALPILVKYELPSNHNIVNHCVNTNSVIWTHKLNDIFRHCVQNGITLRFELDGFDETLQSNNGNWNKFYIHTLHYFLRVPKTVRDKALSLKQGELSLTSESRMMDWEDVLEASSNKCEIGSHTYSHDSLTSIRSPAMFISEVVDSKLEIEKKIGREVRIIALPNGQGHGSIDTMIRKAGFEILLYGNDEFNPPEALDSDFLILKRLNVCNEPFPEMALRIEGLHSRLRKYVRIPR